ncbi:MAG: hypothetical protein M1816_008282 [Peltula sp. TS41687]|nr:MAG: hypothetical protein M1816_008282 [Peltula sp. TS41687]
MRIRRRRHHLSFLLFITLACATLPLSAADGKPDGSLSEQQGPGEHGQRSSILREASSSTLSARARATVGTKDAPVDGKDGKPHAGPWVEAGVEKDKPRDGEGKETLPTRKPSPRPVTGSSIPEVNDGVMDDPNREGPKKGTTGTEGGVSEKTRGQKALEGQTGDKTEKKPDPPKESPPLPHSEEQKMKGVVEEKKDVRVDPETVRSKVEDAIAEKTDVLENLGGLAKPTNLPPKTHDTLPPSPPSSKTDPLHPIVSQPDIGNPDIDLPSESNGLIQPLHSFLLSLTMILFSEIGDKTFLIAALMAMKHPRLLVFSAAFSALIAMTILSAVLGHAVPTLIPKRFTNVLAAILFLVFGAKLLREGYEMRPEENVSEEMKEVEMELEEREQLARKQGRGRRRSSISPYVLEAGRAPRKSRSNSHRLPSPPRSPSSSRSPSPSPPSSSTSNLFSGLNNLLTFLLSPAWVQTFVMTFLGEWGDRSQIATIAMAAGQDYWWVTAGAVSGHAVCTAAAVVGGRAVAGRVSLRVVTLGGAIAFLAFALIYAAEAIYYLSS